MSALPLSPSAPPALPAAPRHRPPSLLRQAWRQGLRDLRGGELSLLIVAVALAVAALSAVGFFAERMQAGLVRDARGLLGGDAVLAADQPLPTALAARASALGLRTAQSTAFPSMARAPDERGGATRLVALKAVDDAYPLRGSLQTAETPGAPTRSVRHGPARGTVWVEPALLDLLDLRPGDPLWLGERALRIAALIRLEPDRGAGFMSFAPRVLLHADDLPATGLLQPGSRVSHRLAVAAPEDGADGDAAVQVFLADSARAIAREGWRGIRVDTLEQGRPEMAQTLERATLFLKLVALLAALLAAVAVAIAARDFAQRHLDDSALLRVLGQSQRRIAGAYALEFGTVGLLASAIGVLLGLLLHGIFVALLAGLMQVQLPPPGPGPALFGLGLGLSLLLGFGLPPVLQLAQVPALRVIRRELGEPRAASALILLAGVAGLAGLLLLVADHRVLGGLAVGGFALAVGAFALVGWAAVALLRRGVERLPARPALRLATRQLAARPGLAVLQVATLAVGLMALLLLVLLRTDLIASWRAATPTDAPDRFVINLQPDQLPAFRSHLAQAGVVQYDASPMIRGRLVAVNGRPVRAGQFGTERANRLVEREFNLSHAAEAPDHNATVGGAWAPAGPGEPTALSVEQGLAQELGLKLGDTLHFDIAGQAQDGRITHLRQVDWASMRVNFFVIFQRPALPELPSTWVAAFRAPVPATGFDAGLSRAFPNLTVVDVSATIAQVQSVLGQVVRAVEFLFGFTLLAGLVVLFAAVAASREQRAREATVMRALGASHALLARVQRAELLGVGALAGTLAALAAAALGAVLARQAFGFPWTAPLGVLPAGAAAGALLAWAAGAWGLRGVLRRPVVESLRRAAD